MRILVIKWFWFLYCLLIVLLVFTYKANAGSFSGLFCNSEESVVIVAEAIVAKNDSIYASLEEHGCVSLKNEIDAVIVYVGPSFDGPDGKFHIIGLAHKEGEMPLLFGLQMIRQPRGST